MSQDPQSSARPEPLSAIWLRLSFDISPLRASAQFRLLWSSRAVTLLGTQVTAVALLVQARQLECDHLNWPRLSGLSSRILAPPGW